VVGNTPLTQSSLCARTSALRASVACAQSLLFPQQKKNKPCIKYSSTILSFFQKARKDRNTKRHFAFGEKTFALRVRVALMNIYPHPL
jgi:hypothetical protein